MAKYGKYNEFGVSKTGEVDPRRKFVSTFIGLLGGNRDSADWLYTKIKDMRGGGKDDGKDDGKNNQNAGGRSPIKDVDFGMDGKPTYTRPIKKFDKGKAIKDLIGDPRDPFRAKIGKGEISKVSVVPTMKDGGVVRGAGKALRGRGRGKMV